MKTRKIRLTNSFHGTEYTIRIPAGVYSGTLPRRTVNRVRRALCGTKGCTCGDGIGQRGMAWDGDEPLKGLEITAQYDGTADWTLHE